MEINIAEKEFELMQGFVSGDERSFAEVYNRYYFVVFRHAHRWLPEKEDAEDITAESFVKLWKSREKFSNVAEIIAFLHVTTRNSCYDFLKHISVKTRKQEDLIRLYETGNDNTQTSVEIWDGFAKKVYGELNKMPKRMREIFLLSFEEGLKPSEIAGRLKLNVQTVSNQKSSALALLKAALSNNAEYTLLLLLMLRH